MTNRENNFDLVRLFGALVVILVHAINHFGLSDTTPRLALWMLAQFPGIEIFFIVSGYLVTASLERSTSIADYTRKRFLRIFPALWACFGFTLLLLLAVGELTPDFLGSTFVPWVFAQLTVFQTYNPEALRSFGVGVVNGSLWTIPVELGLYAMLPALLYAIRRLKPDTGLDVMYIVAVLSAGLWVWSRGDTFPQKLVGVSPLPYFWIFLLGSLAHGYRLNLHRYVRGRFGRWLVGYLALCFVLPDAFAALRYPALAGLVLSAAYTKTHLAKRLLRGNDVSYGSYIYHMLVVNLLLSLGFHDAYWLIPVTLLVTVVLATASWCYVEQPALRRKVHHVPPASSDVVIAAS